MTKTRKPPRWVKPFLRGLARTGEARRAALDAGIDHTTAYARRQAHAEFADAWAEALVAFVAGEGTEESDPSPSHACGALPSLSREGRGTKGEGLPVLQPGADGARAVRGGAERWTAAAEKRFFAALADRANVRSAAAAAGFSTNAIYARRSRRPEFRRLWEAAVETGKARLQMLLINHAEKAFDPELLDVSEEAPQVSVTEALNVLKSREGKERELQASGRGWIGDPKWDEQEDYQEACGRIIERLQRLGERDREEQTAAGWTWCEGFEVMVPPGWVRDPDYVAPPPPPENLCEGERLGLTYTPPDRRLDGGDAADGPPD
ncbi:hypothetical protein [Sphingomonas sp.]|uniref:hypothetical protein n=1 Tax=Sphingomonas sp. TaxID=28214 RepID=UPI00286AB171|nr:hypothetical protein [Sphingomonas sp.]